MKILFKKSFHKAEKKLASNLREKLYTRLFLFEENIFTPILRNHALHGEYVGYPQ